MSCPFCKSDQFYIKDNEDEWETYDFECKNGKIQFTDTAEAEQAEQIKPDRTVYCQRCAWNGPCDQIL